MERWYGFRLGRFQFGSDTGRVRKWVVSWATFGLCAVTLGACDAWTGLTEEEYLERAVSQMEAGDYRGAVIDYRNALRERDAPETRGQLGLAYAGDGEVEAAVNHLSRAMEQGAEPERYMPTLARLYHETGQHGEVRSLETETLEGEARARVLAYQAASAYHRGYADQAGDLLAEAEAYEDPLPEVELARSFHALNAGDQERAREHLAEAIALDRRYYAAWSLKGTLANAAGDIQAALEALDRAIELRPDYVADRFTRAWVRLSDGDLAGARDDADLLVEHASDYPGGHHVKGLLALEDDDPDAARRHFEQALATQREYRPVRPYLAAIELDRGNRSQAEHHLNRYHASGPGTVSSYSLLARLYVAQDRPRDAQKLLAETLTDRPDLVGELGDHLGALYLDHGDHELGIAALRRVIEADPEALEAREMLGLALLLAGQEEEGLQELEAVAADSGGLRTADLTLVQAHIEAERFDQALAAAERIQDKAPDDPQGYNLQAAVRLAQGDTQEARRLLGEGLEKVPGHPQLALNLSSIELAEDDADAAIKTLRAAHAQNPGDGRVAARLADLLMRAGQTQEGLSVLEETLEERPEDLRLLTTAARSYSDVGEHAKAGELLERATRLSPETADLYYLLAGERQAAGDRDGAVQALDDTLAADPEHTAAARERSRQLARAGEHDRAAEVFAPVVEARPEEPEVMAQSAWLAHRAGRVDEAAKLYGEALAARVERPWVLEAHTAKQAAGDPEAGLAHLRRWLEEHPGDEEVRHVLGSALLEAEQYEEARRVYQRQVEWRDDDPVALNNLAWLLREEQPAEALEYAERAHGLVPEEATILDTLGITLLHNDRAAEAVERLEQASHLAPGNPEVQLNLARALRADGREEQARGVLESVLDAHNDFPQRREAEEILAELRR